jgi:hypothetical protein
MLPKIVVKYRQIPGVTFHSRRWTVAKSNGALVFDDDQYFKTSSVFEYSQGSTHPGWRYHNRLPWVDFGGDWLKYDITVLEAGQHFKCLYDTGLQSQYYDGAMCASATARNYLGSTLSGPAAANLPFFSNACPGKLSNTALDTLGALCVAVCAPTNPASDLSVAIGELYRDGLPSLPGSRGGNLGDEYLNLQFGWSPTIQDGRSFINAIRNQDSILEQYTRDSGKRIRRRYELPKEVTSSSVVTTGVAVGGNLGAIPNGNQLTATGTRTVNTQTIRRVWFDGVFSYYIPPDIVGRTVKDLDKAYGIEPDLNTAWNLTPWSWLFDWFTNAGVVLKNLNNFLMNGLVMPWGYVMCETTTTVETSWSGQRNAPPWVPLTLVDKVQYRTKQRRRANPYGFGVDMGSLNAFQISILAALGLSHGR